MQPATAQNVRRLGLAIEAVCLLALLSLWRQKVEPRQFLGIDQTQALMVGLALGFVLWLVGTVVLHWPKTP